jgi:hypothetical protein
MPIFPSNFVSVTIATRLWVLCLAVLLATLPVAGYGNALPVLADSELDVQFEARLVVHDYQSRLAIVSEKRGQAESDGEPLDALSATAASGLSAARFIDSAITAATQPEKASRYRYFQPLLRAPPTF